MIVIYAVSAFLALVSLFPQVNTYPLINVSVLVLAGGLLAQAAGWFH